MKKTSLLALGVSVLLCGGAFMLAAPRKVGPNPDGSFTVNSLCRRDAVFHRTPGRYGNRAGR
jgi:hypothetical protein